MLGDEAADHGPGDMRQLYDLLTHLPGRRAKPQLGIGAHGADRRLACERLAEDAARKAARRPVGLTGPNAHLAGAGPE